jgi:hypothetical protein
VHRDFWNMKPKLNKSEQIKQSMRNKVKTGLQKLQDKSNDRINSQRKSKLKRIRRRLEMEKKPEKSGTENEIRDKMLE